MWIKRQVVMLPTNEKAKFRDLVLYAGKSSRLFINDTSEAIFPKKTKHINLYILSDEKIKTSDWAYCNLTKTVKQIIDVRVQCGNNDGFPFKKIIATTDRSLTTLFIPTGFKSGIGALAHSIQVPLPQPSQQFIEKYVEEYNKGNIITDVMVEYFLTEDGMDDWKHLKVEKSNTIAIRKVKDSWNRKEVESIFMQGVGLGKSIARNTDYYSLHDPVKNWIEQNL